MWNDWKDILVMALVLAILIGTPVWFLLLTHARTTVEPDGASGETDAVQDQQPRDAAPPTVIDKNTLYQDPVAVVERYRSTSANPDGTHSHADLRTAEQVFASLRHRLDRAEQAKVQLEQQVEKQRVLLELYAHERAQVAGRVVTP